MFETLTIPTITPCRVATFLEALDDSSRKNLVDALEMSNSEISHRRIAREIFEQADERMDPETIASHRNGTCRCVR